MKATGFSFNGETQIKKIPERVLSRVLFFTETLELD